MTTAPSANQHFFTVDVEEYFQVQALESVVSRDDWLNQPTRVADSIDVLLRALDRHRVRGTFFVLGWIAKHRPEVVREIDTAGHEIASHGFMHQRVTSLDPHAFREDVRRAKGELESLVGREVRGYRAPSFSITPGIEWAFDILIDEGYVYDSSIFPIRRPGYGYASAPRAPYLMRRRNGPLAEFPLATTSVLGVSVPAAGGGYLRQFPLNVIRRAFQEAARRGERGTFYVHPWEVDPQQPRLRVGKLTEIRHYRGLDQTLAKIEALLAEFSFTTIDSYLDNLLKTPTRLQPVVVA